MITYTYGVENNLSTSEINLLHTNISNTVFSTTYNGLNCINKILDIHFEESITDSEMNTLLGSTIPEIGFPSIN